MGKVSEKQKESVKKYDSKTYDRFTVKVKKAKAESMRDFILHTGESMNGFINRAIDECIERYEKEHR